MKQFYFMRADDKTYHLYVWDTTDKKITLKEKALKLNSLSDEIFILEIETGKFKVVGLSKDSIFEFEIPVFEARLVCGHIIWKFEDKWYAFDYETSKVRLLGTRKDRSFSLAVNCRYNREEECYFIQEMSDKTITLTFVRPEGIVSIGEYLKVQVAGDFLVAYKNYVLCDIFVPYPPYLYVPGRPYLSIHGLDDNFYWQEDVKMWACFGRGVCVALNAFQVHYLKDNKPHAILYKVQGMDRSFVAEGVWQHRYVEREEVATCIDGVIYKYCETENDVFRRLVDFDNPKPTLIKKVKDYFK